MNADQKRFHGLAKKAMAIAGTQQKLAGALGVAQITISRWLNSPPIEPRVRYVRLLETYIAKKGTK